MSNYQLKVIFFKESGSSFCINTIINCTSKCIQHRNSYILCNIISDLISVKIISHFVVFSWKHIIKIVMNQTSEVKKEDSETKYSLTFPYTKLVCYTCTSFPPLVKSLESMDKLTFTEHRTMLNMLIEEAPEM